MERFSEKLDRSIIEYFCSTSERFSLPILLERFLDFSGGGGYFLECGSLFSLECVWGVFSGVHFVICSAGGGDFQEGALSFSWRGVPSRRGLHSELRRFPVAGLPGESLLGGRFRGVVTFRGEGGGAFQVGF